MKITLDLTTMKPATLAAIAADITQQIDAQDWTLDSYEPIDAILVHLFAIPGLTPSAVDDLLADAGAAPIILDNLISRLIITNQIG